jgi:hypothetical protein
MAASPRPGSAAVLSSANSGEPCWYTAELYAREIVRVQNVPADISNLTKAQIESDGETTTKLWARVRWHRHGIGREVIMDIAAGARISVHACDVGIDVVAPANAREIGSQLPSGVQTFPAASGTFLDTYITSSLVCGPAPVRGEATLTQTFSAASGASVFVPVPPGAVAVQIYVPFAAFAVAGTWVERRPPPTLNGALGTISFLTSAPGRTGRVPRPGNAIGISSTNTDGVTRFFTYVWYLAF